MKKIVTVLLLTTVIFAGNILQASAYGSYLLLNINSNQTIATSANQVIPNGGYIYTSNYANSNKYLYGELYRDDPLPIPNTLLASGYMAPGDDAQISVNSIIYNTQCFTELNPAGPNYSGCNGTIGYYFN